MEAPRSGQAFFFNFKSRHVFLAQPILDVHNLHREPPFGGASEQVPHFTIHHR